MCRDVINEKINKLVTLSLTKRNVARPAALGWCDLNHCRKTENLVAAVSWFVVDRSKITALQLTKRQKISIPFAEIRQGISH